MAGVQRFAAVVAAWLAVVGCGDTDVVTPFGEETDTDNTPPDTPISASTTEPTPTTSGDDNSGSDESSGDETDGGGGGQGEPCTSHADCEDWCFDPDGDGMGECVGPCEPDCPRGYECDLVQIDEMVVEACVNLPDTFCNACRSNDDCGGWGDECIPLDGGFFCSVDCSTDKDACPPGFGCGLIGTVGDGKPVLQCVPDNGICCIDADGDIYGVGGGCFDADCDDENPAVHTQADEICDGFDNDCNGMIDDDVSDCAAGDCSLGELGYFEDPPESCVAGECVGDPAQLCDLYTCSEGEEEGDECADACDGEDDLKCVPPAHCDDSVCESDEPDGETCDEASDCESTHCGNGFCCAFGDCCSVAEDCPTFGTEDPICTSPPTCQGTTGATVCGSSFICSNTGLEEDDSACDSATEADDCGYYPSVYCTGAMDQAAPECATSCDNNLDCDPDAHCNPETSQCEPDVNDGNACEGDAWCVSDYCENGFCCQNGDCCSTEANCPASYSSEAVCTSPATCQGERDVAVCNANSCATSMGVADDSACVGGLEAADCGPYPSVVCTGGAVQNPPVCADSCTADSECDADAYCNDASVCVPDESDGETCDADAQCVSGHCGNGFCCESGDCCADDGDCNAYDEAAECTSTATCQGSRVDGECSASSQCGADTLADDSGCAGAIANDCGPYPSVACGNGMNQVAPTCPNSCMGDGDCDASAHCEGGSCVPDAGQGGFCTSTVQCAGGLACVDNVCCTSACNGACEACDVPGSEGTCTDIPEGVDLDNECGGVSCNDYFHSWSGDNCRDRADVPSTGAGCNGSGACETAADLCPSQGVGSVVETCNAQCENPNLATCTGTNDPVCTAVNPGTNTCGEGVCENTMNQCQNGAPLECQPNWGSAGPEVCNNLDDNCDGSDDNGAFSDGYEPNGSCASVVTLLEVGSGQTQDYDTQTIYGVGDNDYYYFHVEETDSSCSCCDFFCTDEDFRVWIDLSVPAGAGSYFLCANTSCASVNNNCTEVLAGQTGGWTFTFDGGCPGDNGYNMYVRIYGDNAPAHECLPYTLAFRMVPGCY